jgi:outer membrane immunogenic protein
LTWQVTEVTVTSRKFLGVTTMKMILLAGIGLLAIATAAAPATAADLPVKAPVYKAAPIDPWNWSGFYIGGNVGYSWGNSDTDAVFSNATSGAFLFAQSNSFDMNGVIGGGQIGYNWQFAPTWVMGIEADIQASGQDGSTSFLCPGTICSAGLTAIPAASAPSTATLNQSLDWFGTVRGRIGYTFTPTILAYFTGGLAYGKIATDGTLSGFNANGLPTTVAFSGDTTKAGWTIGGGIEGRIAGNWTAKIEYLYMDFGTVSTTAVSPLIFVPAPGTGLRADFSSRVTDNVVRVGINYKFGYAHF